ncbi:hypothetical protein BD408DRAFT_225375 [Parasitella parasitica]|nr:hypothetical protein BD408DRAFT_225375 [Parasitella parasitica]
MKTCVNKTTHNTTILHNQPRSDCSNSGTQLMDTVTMSFLDMDEWVAQELQRIIKNQVPRNCFSFEALISIIEGIYQEGHYALFYSPCSPLNETSQCMTHNSKAPEISTALRLPQATQKPSKDQQDDGAKELISISKKCLATNTLAISTHHLTQKNLIMAFMKLVFHCHKQHDPKHFYLQRYRKPLELLIELENMCETYSSWTSLTDASTADDTHVVDAGIIIRIQKRLQCILFGDQIPLVDTLVCPWTLISLWTQQGNPLNSDLQQGSSCKKWIELGVFSYKFAKKACGIGEIIDACELA